MLVPYYYLFYTVLIMSASKQIVNGNPYWIYNSTKKPTIVMIHGFRGTHHGLDLIAKNLDDFRVIIPDLPGFGEASPLEAEHNLGNYVTWLSVFMKDLRLGDKPILLGHSFGSIIAASYAVKFPETIDRLVLENPIGTPALEGPKAAMTKIAVFYYWLGRKLPAKISKKWLSSKSSTMVMSVTMAKTKDKNLRKYIHSEHLEHFSSFSDPQSLAESFKTSVSHNVRQFADQIKVPTLIIAGDQDDITPISKQHELAKLFPSAEIVVIGNVGHLTHYETPDQVASAIKSFNK